MTINDLIALFEQSGKRFVRIGDDCCGVLVGLDLEARLYFFRHGEVVSRVNPDSILGFSDRTGYKNPGGDGLWPAPEGTRLGYEYSTGSWEVPIGLVNARFQVVSHSASSVTVAAEVPLINAEQLGLPTLFQREVQLLPGADLSVLVRESITYMGSRTLKKGEFLLAPWSLCQFDWQENDRFTFAMPDTGKVRDLYTDSSAYGHASEGKRTYRPTTEKRYQIALGSEVPEIELLLTSRNCRIVRSVKQLTANGRLIDIADAPTTEEPVETGVRYSFYNDPSGFLEIEAVGSCTETLRPGQELSAEITTTFYAK